MGFDPFEPLSGPPEISGKPGIDRSLRPLKDYLQMGPVVASEAGRGRLRASEHIAWSAGFLPCFQRGGGSASLCIHCAIAD